MIGGQILQTVDGQVYLARQELLNFLVKRPLVPASATACAIEAGSG